MHRNIVVFTVSAVVSAVMWPVLSAQQTANTEAAGPTEAGVVLDWPREYPGTGGGKLVIYQPQVESWEDYSRLDARAALAYSANDKDPPALGALRLVADTEADLETRLVNISNLEIAESRFPSLSEAKAATVLEQVKKILPEDGLVIALDRIVANLERTESKLNQAAVSSKPPKIFISQRPSILVQFQGEPVPSPIKDNELQFVVNTNWDVFLDPGDSTYYLRNEAYWLKASSVTSSWQPAGELPEAFGTLPAEENWKVVREHLPGKSITSSEVPIIYVSVIPAELILLEGKPRLQAIPGTRLQWVINTDSDLLVDGADDSFYYLVSGRWFRAASLGAEWAFVSDKLPEDFAKIPLDHPRGEVLASVPGTSQAQEAAILAHIPQKATVERDKVEAEVTYDGDPEFKPIDGTSLSYATNTANDVIRVGDLYYLCFQAVWFVSTTPNGPWELADNIPETIYEIPSSSPVYHTTYVRVYDTNPSWVTYGYTSGYWGTYYSWGSVVYGTGWYYPPYYGYGGYYPVYYGYPMSYGMGAYYNRYTGTYGRGASVYGPYGGAGMGAAYNPRTGTYSRGAAAYGPYNSRGWAEAYNPRTGTYARTRQGSNVYSNWGTTGVRRGNDWARTARVSGSQGTVAGVRTSRGGGATVARTQSGLYAGRDGNVYRRSGGSWQKHSNGSWGAVERPRAGSGTRSTPRSVDRNTFNQLNRDRQGRTSGASRSQAYQNWRGSGGARARGGGRRRR